AAPSSSAWTHSAASWTSAWRSSASITTRRVTSRSKSSWARPGPWTRRKRGSARPLVRAGFLGGVPLGDRRRGSRGRSRGALARAVLLRLQDPEDRLHLRIAHRDVSSGTFRRDQHGAQVALRHLEPALELANPRGERRRSALRVVLRLPRVARLVPRSPQVRAERPGLTAELDQSLHRG